MLVVHIIEAGKVMDVTNNGGATIFTPNEHEQAMANAEKRRRYHKEQAERAISQRVQELEQYMQRVKDATGIE